MVGTWCAIAVAAIASGARADEKKKPGLFDFDTWKSPVGRERDAAGQLAPGGIDLTPAPGRPSELRTIRLRIYADRDYRSVVLHWQAKARAQIGRVNGVVEPVFGVRFEIESLREWDRSHFGVPLETIADELTAADPAREVDWVLGLVTPLRGVATSIHQIGVAGLCTRHFVLRGMDDEQEILAFERELRLISVEERQRLYAVRKAHKEVVIFLHEWGHTMGLLHNEDRTIVMNPLYDPKQRLFSDFEQRVVTAVLEQRLSRRAEPYPESADLAALLEKAPADEGAPDERARLAAFVRGRAAAAGTRAPAPGGSGGGPAAGDLPAADVDAFNRAVAEAKAGRPEEAWALLAPVVKRAGARTTSPATWSHLAGLAASIGALTTADDAAMRAGRAAPNVEAVAVNVESERHRLALPLDAGKFGVPPDREPAYVAGYWQTAELMSGADLGAARARLRDFAAVFPDAPGVDVLNCDLELRAKHAAAASKRCEAALAKFKGATRAHYLLGVIAWRAGRDAAAEQHLHQAILLDPSDPTAWKVLASLYRAAGAKQRLAQLESEHQALLATPLPRDDAR
jgi:tetratricopeptide (TPR) repeat protein